MSDPATTSQHEQAIPGVFTHEQLSKLTGYTRTGDIERVLREQGVTPFYGRAGRLFVLHEQFLAARGIGSSPPHDEEPLL